MSNENITETKPVEQTQTQTTTEQDNVKANENLLNTATKENAETTTTTWIPVFRTCSILLATCLMRSRLPTEVPPYFCTTNGLLID